MKFVKLRMCNWRSFHGEQSIQFSVNPDRPVTLLLGPNGAGKTALLNAFTWALYGEFTDGFDATDNLVNLEAVALDQNASTWVELTFEHEGNTFQVRRETDTRRQGSGECDLTVGKNGEPAVQADVHEILPPALKDLFFFPAESFSTASVLRGDDPTEGTSFDVGRAIRALLSGDVYEHARENIRTAIESDALKPPMNYRDETVEAARRAYEQAQAELTAAEERRDELPRLLAEAREDANKAREAAERYDADKLRKWREEHTALSEAVGEAEKTLERVTGLYTDLAGAAHMYFAKCAVEVSLQRLVTAEQAGMMPPKIHEDVIERTLHTERCLLCGEKLRQVGRERVETLNQHVSQSRVAVRGLEVRSTLSRFVNRQEEVLAELRGRTEELCRELGIDPPGSGAGMGLLASSVRSCLDVADGRIRDAKVRLDEFTETDEVERPPDGQSPVQIAMLKQALVDSLETEKKSIAHKCEEKTKRVESLFRDYQKKSGKSKEHERKTKAIGILREAKGYFQNALSGLEEFGRQDFEHAINETYADLIGKPFRIQVGSDFSIKVYVEGTETRLPLSQSEKILLLIAFLGAIARLAPHYAEISRHHEQLTRTGGVKTSHDEGFPVVLDSPISSLDDEYERDVVDALPLLLPQVIVPVSAKSVDVWEGIATKVGQAYVMELTSERASDRTVRWRGRDHRYSVQDEDVVPARTRLESI